jgi:hypothetical protein
MQYFIQNVENMYQYNFKTCSILEWNDKNNEQYSM